MLFVARKVPLLKDVPFTCGCNAVKCPTMSSVWAKKSFIKRLLASVGYQLLVQCFTPVVEASKTIKEDLEEEPLEYNMRKITSTLMN